MHAGVLDPFAAHQQRRVVHPGVLRAGLPHADQPHRIAVGCTATRQRIDLGGNLVVPQPNPASAVDDGVGEHAVAQVRRQHLAVWVVGRQAREGQPAAAQPEPVTAIAQPDDGIDE
jgi:hypothetical protein